MRKILISLIMIILLICTCVVISKGATIGNVDIWGIKTISEENDTIDEKNSELSTLVSVTYQSALASVEDSATKMENAKEEYEDKYLLLGNGDSYLQTEEYEIEFLWTKIGNYANDNDVEIKIDVTNSQISGRYDLNFTVVGKYPDVTQFIYDIENDSRLGFKIEDFKMVASESGVQGTFSCTEIKIDLESAGTTSSIVTDSSLIDGTTGSSSTNSDGSSSSSSSKSSKSSTNSAQTTNSNTLNTVSGTTSETNAANNTAGDVIDSYVE